MRFHCFFEQSGTFKNEFKKLGYEAYDYDILNDFGKTDFQMDLFQSINDAYDGKPSLFDSIGENDQIIAFFPCVRFSNQIYMHFQGNMKSIKDWSIEKKLKYDMKLHTELHELYMLVSKLVCVCVWNNIPLIIENPYSQEHYLTRYWAVKPKVIDDDRRNRGDYFKKPTQYWFVNREPSNNFIFEPMPQNSIGCNDAIRLMNKESWEKTGAKTVKVARSMIHPDYANRFIREFII